MLRIYTLVLKRCDKFDHNLFVAYISSRSHGDNIRDGWFCTQCPECKCSMIHSQVICKRHFAEVSRAYLLRVLPKYTYFWFVRLALRLAQEWGGAIEHTMARGSYAAAQYTAILTSSGAIHVITTCVPEYPNSLFLHTPFPSFLGSSISFFNCCLYLV